MHGKSDDESEDYSERWALLLDDLPVILRFTFQTLSFIRYNSRAGFPTCSLHSIEMHIAILSTLAIVSLATATPTNTKRDDTWGGSVSLGPTIINAVTTLIPGAPSAT